MSFEIIRGQAPRFMIAQVQRTNRTCAFPRGQSPGKNTPASKTRRFEKQNRTCALREGRRRGQAPRFMIAQVQRTNRTCAFPRGQSPGKNTRGPALPRTAGRDNTSHDIRKANPRRFRLIHRPKKSETHATQNHFTRIDPAPMEADSDDHCPWRTCFKLRRRAVCYPRRRRRKLDPNSCRRRLHPNSAIA